MRGKWNIPRISRNILYFKHLIMCREVSIKHLSGFVEDWITFRNPRFWGKWEVNGIFPENYGTFAV
jgi:hypothetical protein